MLRALLLVAESIGAAHARWREAAARLRPLSVEIAVLYERIDRLREENELLRARLRRLPGHRRPHYRPWERHRILWRHARHHRSLEATARAFVVSVPTVLHWKEDVASGTEHLVRTRRAMNALPDLVAEIAQRLKRDWPRWGTRRIAGVLARLGLAASRTSVQRIVGRGPRRPAAALTVRCGPLVPKHGGHMYFVDFTKIGGVFRSVFVGAVIDGFSRKVLALRVCAHEPSAAFAARLLGEAVATASAPTWVITDHGKQFTSRAFGRGVARCGARRRFGAVGRKGSIALIERFWRSMKQEFARGLVLYRPIATIERRLRAYARWFNEERPHQGLAQQTPNEAHAGRSTRPTCVPLRAALVVDHVGGERELPVLCLRSAA